MVLKRKERKVGGAIRAERGEEQREKSQLNEGTVETRKEKAFMEILEHTRVYEEVHLDETSHSRSKTEVLPVMMDVVVHREQ